jgi:hypothetical protein
VVGPAVPRFLSHIPFEPQPVALPLPAARPELQPFFWRDQLQLAADEVQAAEQQLDSLRHADRVPSSEGGDASVRDTLDSAELRLQAALLRVELVGEMQAAELAKQRGDPSAQDAAQEAARTARRWELADAKLQLARAQERRRQPDAPDARTADQHVQEAEKRVADSERALANPGMDYPLPWASIKALEGPDETESSRFAPYPTRSTGRRLALAQWIVHPSNPLTARVAVNHIWLRHFGQPLVESVDDFGRRTPAPPQQALLDWLAVELVESGWRMKHLHRLIVTSQAYRMAGSERATDPAAKAADPENQLYWHRRPMRMQSEVIRDSLLHLAGALYTKVGGPTVDPRHDDPSYRRSLYFTHSRDDQHPLLALFDDPDIFRCYRRQESVVPQQALTLANSRIALLMAEQIADRLNAPSDADPAITMPDDPSPLVADREFIERAFLSLLCRRPAALEFAACEHALDQWRRIDDREAAGRARANLVHSLLNHNDFVTIR